VEKAKVTAAEVGFPILIKASAGGGGKGMRIVEKAEDFEEQMKLAVSEAKSAFGNGAVFIERYVAGPRHIEIQVLGDTHGNIVHLFERECSIQRRHQKVIEEAPSSILSPALREAMGKCAVDVARACNYVGAGTVEFLLDESTNFYFLEMNTRLQVEHPVTEMITGVDLVKEQIEIARGKKISFTQKDLKILGHSLEVRVYAEDPTNQFLPDIGTLQTYRRPQGNGVRVDDGFEEGMSIPIYYDPMISKLISYGKNREAGVAGGDHAADATGPHHLADAHRRDVALAFVHPAAHGGVERERQHFDDEAAVAGVGHCFLGVLPAFGAEQAVRARGQAHLVVDDVGEGGGHGALSAVQRR
ncbi:MAG TPA: ATP-grasp domain-containing protein, partial [Cellvibrionaceae bacterium]|nr:ATP-grasp domain-containing protein [Cellvibrionaceae bacterium]